MNSSGVFKWACGAVVLALAASGWSCRSAGSEPASANTAASSSATVTVRRGTFTRTVRVAGITEAVRNAAAVAPRLAGQNMSNLTITRLVAGGTLAKKGDVIVEFDPQDQVRAAFDRRTEFQDLEQQIRRVEAEQATAYAGDETAMKQAENDVSRAELEVRKNRVLPPIEADKNNLALEEAEGEACRGSAGEGAQAADGRCRHADSRDPARAHGADAQARRGERGLHGDPGAVRRPGGRAGGVQGIGHDRGAGRRRRPARHADCECRRSHLDAGPGAGQPGRPEPGGRRPARARDARRLPGGLVRRARWQAARAAGHHQHGDVCGAGLRGASFRSPDPTPS